MAFLRTKESELFEPKTEEHFTGAPENTFLWKVDTYLKLQQQSFFFWKRCLIHTVILDISGGTNVGKPTFWYRKLRYSGDRLYVIRNTFKLEAQKVDPQKLDYPINYSLKSLISLSRQLCVPWSCSTPYFNQKIHLSLVILNYKGFQVNRKWLN